MAKMATGTGPVSIILGAGASRAVRYPKNRFRSPLDRDFFELLQRLRISYVGKTLERKVEEARDYIVREGLKLEHGRFCHSMEELFYRLHQKTILHHQLFPEEFKTIHPDDLLRERFTVGIQGLLRAAHGTSTCTHHVKMLRPLGQWDAILTFNYDLVAERAFREVHSRQTDFGAWLYGVGDNAYGLPVLHKLHGSINWKEGHTIQPTQTRWSDFDSRPGASGFNILLPYWEKRVWELPWKDIWQRAARQLRATRQLIVWGYSLPFTDFKARELLAVGLRPISKSRTVEEVCIIDPSSETRQRWRQIFLKQKFWGYEKVEEFFADPPPWFPVVK